MVFSFLIAGLAAGVTALCYAELAAMIPAAGSTYSYAYAVFGIFLAWFIGWDLLLEYLFAASTVAVGWAGYAVSLLGSIGIHVPHDLANPPFGDDTGIINLPAIAIVVATCALLCLGTRESARANNAMVVLKLGVLVALHRRRRLLRLDRQLDPFVPANEGGFGDYGVTGDPPRRRARLLRLRRLRRRLDRGRRGAQPAADDPDRPARDRADLDRALRRDRARDDRDGPIPAARTSPTRWRSRSDPGAGRSSGSSRWLDVAAVVGLAATVLVTFYGQTRIFMRMSSDGMLPTGSGGSTSASRRRRSRPSSAGSPGRRSPALLPIDVLGDLVSIGTLLVVHDRLLRACSSCAAPAPTSSGRSGSSGVWLVAPLGIVFAVALMATLPITTWIRLGVWLLIGLMIYFLYARRRSGERMERLAAVEAANPGPVA